jgi:gentisate 1,2-dioxygenase
MSDIFRPAPAPGEIAPWAPLVIPKEAIDAEVDRLASSTPAVHGRRSLIVHPRATEPGLGLTPGIRVTLEVLLPGESTAPARHNSSAVGFCIGGNGVVDVAGASFGFDRYDVWCIPSMAAYQHRNEGDEVQVRLIYSNAALLEKLHVHYEEDPPAPELDTPRGEGIEDLDPAAAPLLETFALTDAGARLMSYERLVNPPLVESRPLHWPWALVKPELDKLHALGKDYRGRRLYLLHNPATGRTNGTTMNFFATMCLRPAGIVDRPHRHIAAAINYFFAGRGYSVVSGERYEWKAGDLMLTAPGFAVHNHASHDEDVYELTIQDSPLHLAMDSLWWQEDLHRPGRLLGSHPGFATNRGLSGK